MVIFSFYYYDLSVTVQLRPRCAAIRSLYLEPGLLVCLLQVSRDFAMEPLNRYRSQVMPALC